MKEPISFFVAGIPKPAGSKRGFYIEKLKRVVITDANKNSKDWKTSVKHDAQKNYKGDPWDCPISLTLTFTVLRPKSHKRSNGDIKPTAPLRPIVKPDVLKLARGVEDALTGVVWVDDSLIVDEHLHKVYGNQPGCLIEVKEVV